MTTSLNLHDVYEQNLNFLIGSGASVGFLPTLSLRFKDKDGSQASFETLAKHFDDDGHKKLRNLLFMHYYQRCIQPGLPKKSKLQGNDRASSLGKVDAVLKEYKRFLETLVLVLEKQARTAKKANIYTTNYDSCFEDAADILLSEKSINCVINDGSAGFKSRSFHTKNYDNRLIHRGIFDKHDEYRPQLNLLHVHGSVFWTKRCQEIHVDYGESPYEIIFTDKQRALLESFSSIVENEDSSYDELVDFFKDKNLDDLQDEDFRSEYDNIPIVNPTKWKFHETVFEEAYYQILRHLSFELERPNTILVVFGFSFADEHILSLVQRSLFNPSLTVYISCFNRQQELDMREKFKPYRNVKYVTVDGDLDFAQFNESVFTLKSEDGL